jgi:DNA-binding CsgD family transcriptional regulator
MITTKQSRRYDGICPMCSDRPRFRGRAYCARCDNKRRRELSAGTRKLIAKPVRDSFGLLPLQQNILRLLCEGLQSSQIARRLQFSLNYIKQQRSEILSITGCINSHHLTAWAALRGYAKLPEQQSSQSYQKPCWPRDSTCV